MGLHDTKRKSNPLKPRHRGRVAGVGSIFQCQLLKWFNWRAFLQPWMEGNCIEISWLVKMQSPWPPVPPGIFTQSGMFRPRPLYSSLTSVPTPHLNAAKGKSYYCMQRRRFWKGDYTSCPHILFLQQPWFSRRLLIFSAEVAQGCLNPQAIQQAPVKQYHPANSFDLPPQENIYSF